MHVGVDADPVPPERERDDQVGGLSPDALQLEKLVDRPRYLAGVTLDDRARDLEDRPRLRAIEPYRVDGALDRFTRDAEHRARGACQPKEPFGRRRGRLVLGAQAQQTRDQRLERIVTVV